MDPDDEDSKFIEKDDAKVIVTTIYNPAGNMKLPSTLNKIVEDIIENMNAIIENVRENTIMKLRMCISHL